MADNVTLWPSIEARVARECKEGYIPTAIRMNEHTRSRLKSELRVGSFLNQGPALWRTVNTINYIDCAFGRLLLKLDATVPDDLVILQVEVAPPRKYDGPIRVDVEGKP